jgi:hypothetical protein
MGHKSEGGGRGGGRGGVYIGPNFYPSFTFRASDEDEESRFHSICFLLLVHSN